VNSTCLPDPIHAYGFPRWKHPIVRQCFLGHNVIFLKRGTALPSQGTLVLWGMEAVPTGLVDTVKIIRLEDGFLRSVGLGADLMRSISWILDRSGIYYNTQASSDLEQILLTHAFDPALLDRAVALRARITVAGLTKYNTGATKWARPPSAKQVILVIGQVESDASIKFGAAQINTNMALLRAVREANPNACLLYKPHPDIVARLRLEGNDEKNAPQWCNEIITDVAISTLFDAVDEVHVITSLAGFEALLREKSVTCWGNPFYSGWGLTTDKAPTARPRRTLTLDALVAGTLIEYPLYLSRDGKRQISPEEALEELIAWRNEPRIPAWILGIYRIFLRIFAGVR